jgi:2-polyprenyl-3-methyl-5-hydroxy-6-metoxy-1,4-benzoquinol methylase
VLHKIPEIVHVSKTEQYNFRDDWYDIATDDNFWMQWRFEFFMKFLKKIGISTKKEYKVIEIGCGTGVFLKQMEQDTNWIISGVDINLKALERSKAKRSRLLLYDIYEKREELKQAFDVVILMDVLEHIQNTQEFIDSCFFLLKPQGLFIINLPALQCGYSVYDKAMGHLRRYNRSKILEEFNMIRYDKVVFQYWGCTLLPLLFLRKILISKNAEKVDAVRLGFRPPGRILHLLLKLLMRAELLFFRNQPIGTSLMGSIFMK